MEETERKHRGPARLADVARLAGVSTATVSRYVNTPGRLGPETAAKVESAVRTLGYTPHFGAQALAANRTNTVGAVIPTMDNAIFATGIQAFQETLSLAGKTLLLASSFYEEATEEAQIRTLVARGAEGLLLIGHSRSAAVYEFLEARQIPVVVSWVYDPNSPRASVGFDNHEAMAALAGRALDLGHRRITMITARQAGNDRVQARIAGVRGAMAQRGLDPGGLQLIETTYAIASGAAAMAEILSRPNPPTLVLCANDVIAVGALRKAQQMGARVPDDISITGFDDMELAMLTEPALTTVRVPHAQMGRLAAETLIASIEGQSPPAPIALKTEVQMRGSLAPPGGGVQRG